MSPVDPPPINVECAVTARCNRVRNAGFTLVELMVAVTGGLFVSMVVFALARDGSRFYQGESRVAEATLANVVAFDRLEHDIARAGFMSTPNIMRDPLFCGDASTIATMPRQLQLLTSINIAPDATAATNPVLSAAGRAPEILTLSGAYNSVDRYEAWHVDPTGSGYAVRLQTGIGALLRRGFTKLSAAAQSALLAELFPPSRALRMLNVDTGTFQISTITGTGILNGEAYVYLAQQPTLNIAEQRRCGLRGTTLVNVVNIIRYSLRTVKGNTTDFANYQMLFATGNQPFEDNRLELVREELDTSGTSIPNTQEVIAEYAVDLQFGLTTVQNVAAAPVLQTVGFNSPQVVETLAGAANVAGARPQDIRAVRTRLSVRSREVDRQYDIIPYANVAPGLYRIQLTDAATKAIGFARVRTLQSDVVLASHLELRW